MWLKKLIKRIFLFGLIPSILFGCYNHANKKARTDSNIQARFNEIKDDQYVLTSLEVKDNFKIGNVWHGLLELTEEDLIFYDYIAYDAFDDLDYELNYVVLMVGIAFEKTYAEVVRWDKVKEIRLSDSNNAMYITNNVLYAKHMMSNGKLLVDALTIANRNISSPVIFDNSLIINNVGMLRIVNNFYQEKVFTKTSEIRIDIRNPRLHIVVGTGAFFECKKLKPTVLIFTLLLTVEDMAFEKSNVSIFRVEEEYTSEIEYGGHLFIGRYAFANSMLNTFVVESRRYHINHSGNFVCITSSAFDDSRLMNILICQYDGDVSIDTIFRYCHKIKNIRIKAKRLLLCPLFWSGEFEDVTINIHARYLYEYIIGKGLFEGNFNSLWIKLKIDNYTEDIDSNSRMLVGITTSEHFQLKTNLKPLEIEALGLKNSQLDLVEYLKH